ncbi:MAG: class I SAM-dependent methyltransferase [Cytophagales bacterium]
MTKAVATKTEKHYFFEKIILNTLLSLPLGRLNITLPSGKIHKAGNGDGSIEANINIISSDFYLKGILYGDIGFAEAYIDGDWETDDIKNVIRFFILNLEYTSFMSGGKVKQLSINTLRWVNKMYNNARENTFAGSKKNIAVHYDLGNAFYELWLDKTMTYSGAYFSATDMSLEEAQFQKYDRLCRQLNLKTSDNVLEIGTGWGANAIHIAKYYGCRVDTYTISEAQYKYALLKVENEGLSHKINVFFKDYREIEGKYSKIVSIEMLEAVGAKYYHTFFAKCDSLLSKNGMLGLQVITCPDSRFEQIKSNVDFIQKHIFPGSVIPSVSAINNAINGTSDLTMVDLKAFGLDYAKTVSLWQQKFDENLDAIGKLGFSEKFIRKWKYYLSYCEAAFDMKNINVMQLIYAKPNHF